MTIYITMTAASCLLAYVALRRPRGKAPMLFWMLASALPLILVSALRWNIGTDYAFSIAPEYDAIAWYLGGESPTAVGLLTNVQNALIHYDNAFHSTRLYYLIELGLVSLGADVQLLIALFALWTMGFVFLAIYRQSNCPWLAIFLFVFSSNYFLSFNIMRQYFAVSLCLVAFESAEKRKPLPFVLLVLLAALFHPTALVFLPVYILPRIKVKPLYAALAIGAALLVAPLARMALEAVVPRILPKYAWYFDSQFDAGEFEMFFFLINMAVFALSAWYYKAGRDNPYFTLWYNTNLLGTAFLAFSAVIPLMKRLNYYYAACHFLFIPLLLSLEQNKKRRYILTALVCLAFLAETYVAVVLMNKNGVYPYMGIWAKTVVPYMNWAP